LAQLKTVHTALWPHCPNKDVFSNWPYDSPHSTAASVKQTCL